MNVDTCVALIREDLSQARKQRDELTVKTLSSVLNAIDNASAVALGGSTALNEVERRLVSPGDLENIISSEIAELERAVELYRLSNVSDLANEMSLQVEILQRLQARIT